MSITINTECERCHRQHGVNVASLAEGAALDELQKKKAANLKRIQGFINAIPENERPDFFAWAPPHSIGYVDVCDPAGDKKRSCSARLEELLTAAAPLKPRGPKTSKDVNAIPLVDAVK